MRYYADHTNNEDQRVRVEIVEVGSVEDFSQFKGNAEKSFYKFEHQKINPEKPFDNPVQKGSMEVHVWVRTQAQQDFIDAIMAAQEGSYRIHYYIDPSTNPDPVWTGNVLPDLCEYDESGFKERSASLYAKDVSILGGKAYPLTNGRIPIIEIIAELLDHLSFDLDIFTATSWTEGGITEADDYLRQIYADRYALRQYGKKGELGDEITVLSALEQILSDNMLVMKQWKGWRIDQLTAYDDPSAVVYSEYTSAGVLTQQTTADRRLTFNRDNQRITIGSVNKGIPGIKSASVVYEHRTKIQNINFEPVITFDGLGTDSENQLLLSDGTQRLRLTGEVEAFAKEPPETPDFATAVSAEITILFEGSTVDYYWNGASWVSSFASVEVDLGNPGGNRWLETINILTDDVPNDSGTLTVTIRNAETDQDPIANGSTPTKTSYYDLEFSIVNPSIEEGENTSVNYILGQSQDYSIFYTHKPTWFGDGPTSYARSALSTDDFGDELTAGTWLRRGEVTSIPFHHLLLREIMDLQRSWRRNLSATVKGVFEPDKITVYDSENFFYLGGSQSGLTGNWTVEFFRINIESEADTFEELFNVGESSVVGGGNAATVEFVTKRLFAIGITRSDLNGNYTSIPVELYVDVPSGVDLNIVTRQGRDYYGIVPTENNSPGYVDMAIEEEYIDAPGGSYILIAPEVQEAEFQTNREKIRVLDEITIPALEDQIEGLDVDSINESINTAIDEAVDLLDFYTQDEIDSVEQSLTDAINDRVGLGSSYQNVSISEANGLLVTGLDGGTQVGRINLRGSGTTSGGKSFAGIHIQKLVGGEWETNLFADLDGDLYMTGTLQPGSVLVGDPDDAAVIIDETLGVLVQDVNARVLLNASGVDDEATSFAGISIQKWVDPNWVSNFHATADGDIFARGNFELLEGSILVGTTSEGVYINSTLGLLVQGANARVILNATDPGTEDVSFAGINIQELTGGNWVSNFYATPSGDVFLRGEIAALSGSFAGTVTMDTGGEITNAAGDFTIDDDGIAVAAFESGDESLRSYKFMFGATEVARIFAQEPIQTLRIDALETGWDIGMTGDVIDLTADTDIDLTADDIDIFGSNSVLIRTALTGSTITLDSDLIKLTGPLELPNYTETQRDNIPSPQPGWVIHNTTTARPNYHDGTNWVNF